MNSTARQYNSYRKPSWSPPSWLFAPVWTVLYILITVSFGYSLWLFVHGSLSFLVLLPFILNLLFNAVFTFIQFRLRNYALALVDILLVLVTLVWAMAAIYPIEAWIAYINIPYLLWVSFATVLQIAVTSLNRT